MGPARAPSGRQIEIRAGESAQESTATVVEVGGGLRTFTVGGRAILDGYGADEMCTAGRGQVLLPWPNRLAGGRYTFEGQELQLPITDGGTGSAIHGLARWQRWELAAPAPDTCVATLELPPQPGWPFLLDLTTTYTVLPGRLDVTIEAVNVGPGPCPFGAGQHPYIAVPVDTTALRLPAATRLELDGGIPTGRTLPAERDLSPIGERRLDDCYTDLDPDWLVEVIPPDGPRLQLSGDPLWRYLQVFSGDTVPQPERRRQGLAIEPMTCPPNAFATGEGLIVLEPGESFRGGWALQVAPEAAGGTAA
jgi:aldose 1-epimerase